MRDKYDDHRDIMAVCHDIAPQYRPHHTTTAFWEGVDDARWGRTDMARKLTHDGYCAGVETFIRAFVMVEAW
jgi:hypothetical protein